MEFVPFVNCAAVSSRFTLGLQQIECSMGVEFALPIIQDDLEDVAASVGVFWTTIARYLLPPAWVFRETYIRSLDEVDGMSATWALGAGLNGFYGSIPMPNNVTIAISFRTAKTGRSHRGRNFWPGLAHEAVNGNSVVQALCDDIAEAYTDWFLVDWLPLGGGQQATWVVLSRYNNNAPRLVGVATPVTSVLVVDNIVDSQRRRLPGRGN